MGEKSSSEYLDGISSNATEKADIVNYVSQLRNSSILEIGPGAGTALAEIVKRIEKEFKPEERPEIIVFDIISDILERVKEVIGQTEINLKYVLGDKTNLPFKDESIGAINLSAVAHEIFSYGGGYSGINRLAKECCRVMKPNGILAYRDPDGLELHSLEEAEFSNAETRGFLAFFLPKFLDRKYSDIRTKVDLGYTDPLRIYLNGKQIGLFDLQNLRPEEIEKSKITIMGKSGLIHEIQRHFILFTKTFEKNQKSDVSNMAIFSIDDKDAAGKIKEFLESTSVIFKFENNQFELSTSSLNILYQRIKRIGKLYRSEIKLSNNLKKILEWGKREGEENYFYGSCEEIVARFAHFSIIKDNSGEIGYSCLCPISKEDIMAVERDKHSEIIKENIKRTNSENMKDKKRHIHFSKMPIEKAFPILLEYYQENEHPALLETLRTLTFILRESSFIEQDIQDIFPKRIEAITRCADTCIIALNDAAIATNIFEVRSLISAPHLGIVGGMASGKTTVGKILEKEGYKVISLSEFIKDELKSKGILKPTREDYFKTANELRQNYSMDILARLATKKIIDEGIEKFVIDGMRNPEEIYFLREFIRDFILIGVETSTEERIRRVQTRLREIDSKDYYRIFGDISREFFDPSSDGCRLGQVMSLTYLYINGDLPVEEIENSIKTFKIPPDKASIDFYLKIIKQYY